MQSRHKDKLYYYQYSRNQINKTRIMKFNSLLLLLIRWCYSPVQTSPPFLDLSFQFLIWHLLISVCTQFHHLFSDHPLSWLPSGLLLSTWLTFLLLFILLTWPIQFNLHIVTNESTSKSPNSYINSLFHCFLQFSFTRTLIPLNIPLKTFLSRAASRLQYLYLKPKILLHMLSLVLLRS
jgi:hypothetical protein